MQFQNVTCPHCGLLCDDLSIEVSGLHLQLNNLKDPVCKHAFEDALLKSNDLPVPTISGNPASIDDALNEAAELLRASQLPLVNGLVADVQSCREAIALTEKLGGVVDHLNGNAMRKSVAVMQRIGEVKTTLAEVRNRADCVVIFGKGVSTKFPRLLPRILTPEKTLGNGNTKSKKIFIVDVSENGTTQCETDNNITQILFNYPVLESLIYRFQEVVTRPKEYFSECDKETEELFKILDVIAASQYTTIIWTVSNFNPESAEHTVQALTETIKTLMKNIRCVALPLGGSKGEVTANHVATWQTGVALPISFTQGTPIHDPVIYDGMKMIQHQETDCLLWIASYNSKDMPPKTDIPTILFGHPNMKCEHADVFIPVGVPGIDQRGLACRTDSVATLPLQRIRESNFASASDLLHKLNQLF